MTGMPPISLTFDFQAKEAAIKAKIPVLPGSPGLKSVQEATAFLQARDQDSFIGGIYTYIYNIYYPHVDQYGFFHIPMISHWIQISLKDRDE